jgi:aminobenzoyl-glutamate utilization protein B
VSRSDEPGPPPGLDPVQQSVVDDVAARADELADLNHTLWQYAEVGLQEHKSAALLVQKLKDNGFAVETGVAHMPTAFVASFGEGQPIIGILAEYDALPGLSQKTVPDRDPVEDGAAGHGCGHSGLGTAAVGAAIAVKQAMQEHGLKGTIRLYGTPAEETLIGKVYMLLDGQFDDLDVCLHWHPSDKNQVWGGSSKAAVSVKFTFHGLAAHGAGSPHEGRSALDGVELMNVGVNFMREHVKEDCRMHYVVTNGGGQPNVVPPEATVWYYVRADQHDDVETYFAWVKDIAQGAALMSRTKLDIQIDTDCHELIPNDVLSEAIHANLVAVGPPTFTPEEHLFATRILAPLQAEFGLKVEAPLREQVETLAASKELGKGSTDVGDISWKVPTSGLRAVCFAAESPGHSWQNVACIGSSIGDKGTVYAAKVLAATAVQLLQDEDLRAAARAEFEAKMKDRKYTTLIPEGQKAPASIR